MRVARRHGDAGLAASRSTASGKDSPSVSIRKVKMSPFLRREIEPVPFWSLTKKDGVFSALNGERPANSRPCLRSFTRRPTTAEAGSRARISSRKEAGKRMGCGRPGFPASESGVGG